jgi:hypothetical protein
MQKGSIPTNKLSAIAIYVNEHAKNAFIMRLAKGTNKLSRQPPTFGDYRIPAIQKFSLFPK